MYLLLCCGFVFGEQVSQQLLERKTRTIRAYENKRAAFMRARGRSPTYIQAYGARGILPLIVRETYDLYLAFVELIRWRRLWCRRSGPTHALIEELDSRRMAAVVDRRDMVLSLYIFVRDSYSNNFQSAEGNDQLWKRLLQSEKRDDSEGDPGTIRRCNHCSAGSTVHTGGKLNWPFGTLTMGQAKKARAVYSRTVAANPEIDK